MPPVKPRDMEDTWNPAELGRSLKESKEKRRRPKDGDRDEDKERRRKERPKDDEERKHRRRKEEDGEKPKERKDRERDRDKDKDRDKDRDREKHRERKDRDRDREKRHRDKENGEGETKRRSKDEDEVDGSRRRRRHNEENDEEKRQRREERRKKRDEEGGKEKRSRDGEDREKRHRDKDDKEKRHRDGEDREKKHRDGEDKERRHKERDGEREHRRRRDEDGDERRRHRDENGERKHRDRKDREERDKDRDRGHRDREKRHEREKDVLEDEGNHRRHRDKEKEREKKKEEEETKKTTSKKEADGDDYDYDDDDFEDYEEDFEEDDDDGDEEEDNKKEVSAKDKVKKQNGKSREEMDDILRAMDAENDRLLSATKRDSRRDDSDDDDRRTSSKRPTTSKPRSFINFVSAKQRVITNKASQRTKTRGRELFQIIELDRAAFDLFDMPPVREYELYIRTYGRSDTKQKYIQTNEDNIEKEIQTEEIDTREMWCQCPPEDAKGYGGETESLEDLETKPIDTVALTKFVQKAGQTMLILLEEDRVEAAQSDTSQKRSNICLSEAFLEIYAPPFLKGRCVSFTQFSEAQTHMMLTVYDRPSKPIPGDNLSTKGAICVWNVNETSQPQKILMCEGQPKCCCFSPVKTTLVFAGMTDGSIAVWDLREDNSIHKLLRMDDQAWYLRSPTYNTAGVLHYENHQSAVSSIVPIYVPDGPADDSEIEGSSSFQLASVEENAIVNLWVVAEILNPEPGGSESDLGLAPHGRVKLIKSSAIKLDNPARDAKLRTTMKAFEMQLLPSDPSHFYVGTDTGHIIHGVRFGGKAPPKAYKPDIDAPVEVTSLDFSPFTEPVFLAGCADGSIRLYHIGNPAPLLVWENTTNNAAVLTVRWCQSRPSVFFVVDVTSRLYIWDLLMSDAVPMKEEKISQDKLTSFCLSKDYASTGLGAAGRKPAMAVSFDDGRVEVHTVSQQFSALMPEEVDQFAQFLDNAA